MAIAASTQLEALRAGSYVSDATLEQARARADAHGTSVVDELRSTGAVTDSILGQAMAEYLETYYIDFGAHPPAAEALDQIPAALAEKHRLVFASETEETVTLATDDPEQSDFSAEEREELVATLQQHFPNKRIELAYALPKHIADALLQYRPPLSERLEEIYAQEEHQAPQAFRAIVAEALARKASDIHLEPHEEQVGVRLRIDGVLQHLTDLTPEHYQRLLNRIKVLAGIRTDEHTAAQDGAIRFSPEGREQAIDLRVSIAPLADGEKVVLRLLAVYVEDFTLAGLGLSGGHRKLLEEAAHEPFGMILVTGPTGSGKTTTLYALLQTLDSLRQNIATIEDPIEYRIPGVNHMQVNPEADLTFATGLRSIVRQDPDTILVGEIRDKETAEIAVNAALTGHLLFSTFHANDAATTVPRLLQMGIAPFLLTSTLNLIVAQRLVRTLCTNCRFSKIVPREELRDVIAEPEYYFADTEVRLYESKGCSVCNHTGYQGRTALFEMIPVSEDLRQLMITGASAQEIRAAATENGYESMFADGIAKVKHGETTLAEVRRVVSARTDA